MSNIKPTYWLPCLGIALMWHDPGCSLNPAEERVLMIYHLMVIGMLLALTVAGLWSLAPA